MHRAISGDLQNEEEMDRAMEESGEEGIYQVTQHFVTHKQSSSKQVCRTLSVFDYVVLCRNDTGKATTTS